MNESGNQALQKATGAFIQKNWGWTWFATLTHPDDCVTPRQVEADVRKWLKGLALLSKSHVIAAVGIEEQIRGAAHAHLLVSFEQSTHIPTARAGGVVWTHGEALVVPYESGKGAPWYLAKKGRWGIMSACNRLHRPSRCKRRGGCVVAREDVPFF